MNTEDAINTEVHPSAGRPTSTLRRWVSGLFALAAVAIVTAVAPGTTSAATNWVQYESNYWGWDGNHNGTPEYHYLDVNRDGRYEFVIYDTNEDGRGEWVHLDHPSSVSRQRESWIGLSSNGNSRIYFDLDERGGYELELYDGSDGPANGTYELARLDSNCDGHADRWVWTSTAKIPCQSTAASSTSGPASSLSESIFPGGHNTAIFGDVNVNSMSQFGNNMAWRN